jgi:hypothetical protein
MEGLVVMAGWDGDALAGNMEGLWNGNKRRQKYDERGRTRPPRRSVSAKPKKSL